MVHDILLLLDASSYLQKYILVAYTFIHKHYNLLLYDKQVGNEPTMSGEMLMTDDLHTCIMLPVANIACFSTHSPFGLLNTFWALLGSKKSVVVKLLSEDPANYDDAPTEGIRRILQTELVDEKEKVNFHYLY